MSQIPHHRRISSHPICCKGPSLLVACLLGLAVLLLASCADSPGPGSGPPAEPARGALTALQRDVDRLRSQQVYQLAQAESVELVSNDTINVHPNGRAEITFAEDDLVVELFRGSKLEVEVRQQPAGSVLIQLFQIAGHSDTKLKGLARDRIQMATSYATFRPTEPDTEFSVCHGQALSCMVVANGAVEAQAQGKVVTVRGGEATYILAGQQPADPICADTAQVRTWLDTMRSNSEQGNLGSIVQSWPQAPCGQAASGAQRETAPDTEASDIVTLQLPTPGAVRAGTAPSQQQPALPAAERARFKYSTHYVSTFPCPAGVNGSTATVNVELGDRSFVRLDGSYQAVWSQQPVTGGGALVSSIGMPSDLAAAGPVYLWIADRSGSRSSNIVDVGTGYGPWKSTYLDANHMCANIAFVFTEASRP